MEARYNVYFAGQLLEGHGLDSVRDKLAKLFNADQQTLDKLFSGKAQLLKRDCDKATALQYKQAMERAGAQPLIRASEAPAAVKPPAPANTMTAAEKIAALAAAPDENEYRATPAEPAGEKPPEAAPEADGLNLTPAGTDVLSEDERAAPVTREVDTTGLEIDAAAQRLSAEPPPPPAAPDTSHLDLGGAGETIPNLPSDKVPLSPNTDGIGLTPEGTDFTDCAPPESAAPDLDLSAMELAAAGTDVLEEKYRKREQVEAPATDHLSVEQ